MKQKLCVIGLRGIPDIMGGIETHCENLYPKVSNKYDITVIGRKGYLQQSMNFSGIQVIPIFCIKNKYLESITHTFIAILYAKFFVKTDILHIHGIGPASLTWLSKSLGLKTVVTHHGADYNRQKWGYIAKKVLKFGEWAALKWSNQIIVVGSTLSNELQNQHPTHRKKVHYIPNGLPNKLPTDSPVSEDIKFLKTKKYVLAVSRLVPEKGLHDLIAAYNLTSKTKLLVIAGAADHADSYAQELLQQQNSNILFLGCRTRTDIDFLYKNCDLFVLPSYHEGLPIAALEAIAANAKVLLSDISPNLDIGLDSSNYFPVGRVDNLKNKIENNSSISNNYPDVDQFDWNTIAIDYKNLLTKL